MLKIATETPDREESSTTTTTPSTTRPSSRSSNVSTANSAASSSSANAQPVGLSINVAATNPNRRTSTAAKHNVFNQPEPQRAPTPEVITAKLNSVNTSSATTTTATAMATANSDKQGNQQTSNSENDTTAAQSNYASLLPPLPIDQQQLLPPPNIMDLLVGDSPAPSQQQQELPPPINMDLLGATLAQQPQPQSPQSQPAGSTSNLLIPRLKLQLPARLSSSAPTTPVLRSRGSPTTPILTPGGTDFISLLLQAAQSRDGAADVAESPFSTFTPSWAGAAAQATAATRRIKNEDDNQPKYKLANMSTQPISARARSHSLAWAAAAANARKRSKSMGLDFALPRSDMMQFPQPSPGACSINSRIGGHFPTASMMSVSSQHSLSSTCDSQMIDGFPIDALRGVAGSYSRSRSSSIAGLNALASGSSSPRARQKHLKQQVRVGRKRARKNSEFDLGQEAPTDTMDTKTKVPRTNTKMAKTSKTSKTSSSSSSSKSAVPGSSLNAASAAVAKSNSAKKNRTKSKNKSTKTTSASASASSSSSAIAKQGTAMGIDDDGAKGASLEDIKARYSWSQSKHSKKMVGTSLWYSCRWNCNGVLQCPMKDCDFRNRPYSHLKDRKNWAENVRKHQEIVGTANGKVTDEQRNGWRKKRWICGGSCFKNGQTCFLVHNNSCDVYFREVRRIEQDREDSKVVVYGTHCHGKCPV